jgi:hypothetical protein
MQLKKQDYLWFRVGKRRRFAPRTATRRNRTAQDNSEHFPKRMLAFSLEYFNMRKLIVSATAAALLASGSVAFAAVKHTTGTIKSYDGTALSLVLDDGSPLRCPRPSRILA